MICGIFHFMRASRLLQMLLLLQNRGRLSCATLADELEVTRRTILRDVDALTEAGLPIVSMRGNQGGVELGFNYRTRLTGLDTDEAEALAVLFSTSSPAVAQLGMTEPANRAKVKLVESFPDSVRKKIETARKRFQFEAPIDAALDSRIPALAEAVRARNIVYINATTSKRQCLHPSGLALTSRGWEIIDSQQPETRIPHTHWGDINISANKF
jgi:predicted DNA-binding transcriptional regulator YafY